MPLLKRVITILLFIICLHSYTAIAQYKALITNHRGDSIIAAQKEAAMQLYRQLDTVSASVYWPHVKPALFFANIRKNILYPERINQGASTNFCGYAALTHLLITYQPDLYLKHMIELYRTGKTALERKMLEPTPEVLQAAGTLRNKGELDILHADQLWFLTLADQFKGYINFFDHHYDRGDENRVWAGTNYAKFNKMVRAFTDNDLITAGSDFLRPWKSNFYDYITRQLRKGLVMLYVNSNFLYPHKYTLITLRAPTHFIVLYDMYKVGDMIQIRYWDYGMKTEQLITRKRLRQLIFGVTTITNKIYAK